ncbi:MAG: glycoside hydrolase, partial [Clostridia bacterium]|nr:glycoside hydrolase [Clostridia bacterium]
MERLQSVGTVRRRTAAEVQKTRLGIGFEKLDRAVFDPEKAYDKIAAIGVKWARIQSGWARTEKTPGVY